MGLNNEDRGGRPRDRAGVGEVVKHPAVAVLQNLVTRAAGAEVTNEAPETGLSPGVQRRNCLERLHRTLYFRLFRGDVGQTLVRSRICHIAAGYPACRPSTSQGRLWPFGQVGLVQGGSGALFATRDDPAENLPSVLFDIKYTVEERASLAYKALRFLIANYRTALEDLACAPSICVLNDHAKTTACGKRHSADLRIEDMLDNGLA